MTDKELRHLGRARLIDIVYEQQKRLETSEKTIQKLQAKLSKKELQVLEAGSIAEAALKVNGVFEAAQAAADQYLTSIKAALADTEKKIQETDAACQDKLQDAEAQATQILQNAELKSHEILNQTDTVISERWAAFQKKSGEFIHSYRELSDFLEKDRS